MDRRLGGISPSKARPRLQCTLAARVSLMSASSLPAYRPPSFARSPASPVYTPEPQAYEQRLALNRIRERPSTEFVKQSKTGGVSLRLSEQEDNASLPVYGCGDSVEGTIDLAKPESASGVEVRVGPAYAFCRSAHDRGVPSRSRAVSV